jgi:serine/threonine-protein kinase
MIHTTLGRYRILGELGRGAMGTVYRAHDPLIEREVAVKTLHPDLPPEVIVEVRERFLREAKSAGRLNHPNIVTIFDVGEHDGVAYMAMELLEGRSLQQILGESARLSFQAVADLVAQIADALDRAQQLGIVHRDVKPANVVVSVSGHAKLTDFGVAFVPASTMTQTGTMIGSPRYMSPEQVLGLPIDPRSDIFSLGVVLYEMLAGRAPFVRAEDSTIFPLINRIAAEPHPPVTQVDPSIPAAFEVILSKALAKKPDDRYQRAGAMANDLRNLGSVEPSRVGRTQAEDEKTMLLARGPQTDQPHFEKTVVLPAGQAVPAPEAAGKANAFVLEDLDAFSRNFEVEQEARLRAEEEARRQKEEELRRWSETEARKRETFERQRLKESEKSGAASVTGADTGSRRGALDMLKKTASTRSPEDDAAAKKAKADMGLDQSLRAALQYLAEVARELNGVNPTTGRPYDYVFLGRLPAVKLSSAFADLRNRKINGKDHGEHLFFRFRAQPTAPVKAILLGAEIARCHEYFKALNIPFEAKPLAKNDFGEVTRAAFTVSAPLPCEVNIRADYDDESVEIELVNVRRPGRVRCRIEPEELDDVVDDLARYLLGVDDDFDKVLNRR